MVILVNGCRLNGRHFPKTMEMVAFPNSPTQFSLNLREPGTENGASTSFSREVAIALSALLQDFINRDKE